MSGNWRSVANDVLISIVPDATTFWKLVGNFQKVGSKTRNTAY